MAKCLRLRLGGPMWVDATWSDEKPSSEIEKRIFLGQSLADTGWQPAILVRRPPRADWIGIGNALFVAERLRAIIEPLAGGAIEFLEPRIVFAAKRREPPPPYDGPHFSLMHITNIVECLDEVKSTFSQKKVIPSQNRITYDYLTKMYLLDSKTIDYHVFRISGAPYVQCFSDELFCKIKSAKSRGMDWYNPEDYFVGSRGH